MGNCDAADAKANAPIEVLNTDSTSSSAEICAMEVPTTLV
jgi:hypothetical protein